MTLTIDDVRHVAKLARLAMTEEELARMLPHLNNLMEQFNALAGLDTTDVAPTSHAIPVRNVFRDDEPHAPLLPDSFLRSAPQAEDGLFIVPRIVEDEG